MNTGYMIQQAERTPSSWEQQQIDATNAQIVASVGRIWRALTAPVRAMHPVYRDGGRTHVQYHVPAPRRADCG